MGCHHQDMSRIRAIEIVNIHSPLGEKQAGVARNTFPMGECERLHRDLSDALIRLTAKFIMQLTPAFIPP